MGYRLHVFLIMFYNSYVLKNVNFDKITLGDSFLDNLFEGGVPCRQITEFAGGSATGKTQLMIQLALTVQWPGKYGGLAGGCIFIKSDSYNWAKRAKEIAEANFKNLGFGSHSSLKN